MDCDRTARARHAMLIPLLLVVEVLASTTEGAQPAAPNTRAGCFGSTFKGGDRNKSRWVQLGMADIFAFPDGRVVTDCPWDEAGRAIGFYNDGDVIGEVDDFRTVRSFIGRTREIDLKAKLAALPADAKPEQREALTKGLEKGLRLARATMVVAANNCQPHVRALPCL